MTSINFEPSARSAGQPRRGQVTVQFTATRFERLCEAAIRRSIEPRDLADKLLRVLCDEPSLIDAVLDDGA